MAPSEQQMDDEPFEVALRQAVRQSKLRGKLPGLPGWELEEGESLTSQRPRQKPTTLLDIGDLPARLWCRHTHRMLGGGEARFSILDLFPDPLRPHARQDGVAVRARCGMQALIDVGQLRSACSGLKLTERGRCSVAAPLSRSSVKHFACSVWSREAIHR